MRKFYFLLLAILLTIGANSQTRPVLEQEPNNTSATANVIPTNPAKIRGYIFGNGDVDYYTFTANAGDKVYAAVQTSFSSSGSSDSQLDLLASDGTTSIEFDDDDGTFAGLSSSIAGAVIPSSGTYYLRVKHFSATSQLRPYDLYIRVQSGSPVAEVESNDTPATANAVPGSGWISGSRNPALATEQDWYSITLAAGESVFLSMDCDPERDGIFWNGRLGFGLFGDATNQILVADDANTGTIANPNSEAFFFTAKDAGTYYVFIDATSAAVGGPTATYNVSVSKFAANAGYTNYASSNVPVNIGPGTGVVTSTLTIPDSKRIKDISVRINLNHALMGDIDATLTSPGGNIVHLISDVGAASTGGQSQMDLFLNDNNSVPPSFTVMKGVGYLPENNAFLDYFKGMNTAGTWTLTIYDDGANTSGGTLNSWSLDILEDNTPDFTGATVLASTDFEANDGGFTHSGTQDEWEYGTPATAATTTVAAFNTANSGVNCWKTDLDNTYNASSNQLLESPTYDLTTATGSLWLTWSMKYQMESASFDLLSVFVEEVGNPANTQNLFTWYGATQNMNVGNPSTGIPMSAGWGTHNADISAFAGKQIRFKVRLTSDGSINLGGVAIDDVMIRRLFVCVPPTITLGAAPSTCAGNASVGLPYTTTTGTPDQYTIDYDAAAEAAGFVDVTVTALPASPITLTLPPGASPATYNATITVINSGTGCSSAPVGFTVDLFSAPPAPVITPAAPVVCAGTIQQLSASGGSGSTQVTFNSTGAIQVPATPTTSGIANPYPSIINVSGLPATGVTVKSVTINGVVHTFPDDVDIALQSPTGTNVILMSDVGGSVDNTGENYTFDDAAPTLMADAALNPSGTYKPTNIGATDAFAAPGPGSLTQATPVLSSFGGNMNGDWNLYIVDDLGGDAGSISSWSITFDVVTTPITWSPATGLFTNPAGTTPYVAGTSSPTVYANPGTTTVYTATVTTGACSSSSSVTLTVNPIPTVNAVSNQTLCSGASTTAVNFTGAVGGTVYNWTNNTPSIGLAASGTGDIASFVATNAGPNPVTATITVTPTYTNAGVTCTGTTRTFTITVNPNLVITTQPVDRTICAGQNTTFNVVVSGAPTYQWQVNPGSGFVNLTNTAPYSGVTTATLAINAAGTSLNGNTYQVVITSPCGNTTSSVVTLTVNPLPTVSVGPNGQCAPVTLTATGNSNTYSWSPATGLNTTTGATVIASPTGNTTYTVTGTITATGCTNTATVNVLGTPPPVVVTPSNPAICAGQIQQLTVLGGTAVLNSSGTITIPFGAPGTTSGFANPYPSTITASGLPVNGVTVKSVTINGMSHTFPDDVDIVLQSPTGQNVILMSDAGGGADMTGQSYTFDDAAAALLADGALSPSGTYRPSNYGTPDTWVAPGPGALTQATPTLSSFTGNPNGNWGLYIVDDAGGDAGSIQSWSITFNIPTATWAPATGLFLDPAATIPYVAGTMVNTVYASPASTTTYTVTGTLGTCSVPSGTVTVTVNPKPTINVTPNNQCGPVTLTASGTSNTYSWTPAAGLSATTGASVVANPTINTTYTVTGTITATGCTNTATVNVNATPAAPVITPSAITICRGAVTTLSLATGSGSVSSNSGAITVAIPDNNAAGVSNTLAVTGIPAGATVTGVSVNFNVTHTFDGDLMFNLQAPNNNILNLVNRRGGAGDNFTNTVISSSATTAIAAGTAPFTGTFLPDGANAVGPTGFVSNVTTFPALYSTGNGNWTLAIRDNAGLDVGTLTSWGITISYTVPAPVWSPATGLFTNPAGTTPYVAGTPAATVYAAPTTTTTYSATVPSTTSSCVSPAATSVVTVLQPLVITTQPANQTVCTGANATFSVVVTGNQASYQWQISTDGGTTWNNITNANATALTVSNTTLAMSGNRYRVIITNTCSTVTSNAATLTVNSPTPVTISALPSRICLSDTLVALSATPAGGNWSGIGVSGNNFIPGATAVGSYTLTYSYTNASGCSASGTIVARVEDCQDRNILLRDDAVILFPNPNNGRFNIRINSVLYNYLGMHVYDASGRLVRTQQFGGLVYGRVIPIDITNLPGGVYMVKFFYDDGVRTSEKTFKVIVGR